MKYRLLLSGDRSHFTILEFDHEQNVLTVTANYPAPHNASWVELVSSTCNVDHLIGVSERDDSGYVYTFDLDHMRMQCQITSQQVTKAAPAHFITLKRKSAIALAAYYGGSVSLYPIAHSLNAGLRPASLEIFPEFFYKADVHGPNSARQRQSHPHQVLEDSRGLLYVPDLGSDCVWIMHSNEQNIEICGRLQCPRGSGPRHAVFSPDEKLIYVLGELSHTVIVFDLTIRPVGDSLPLTDFEVSIVHPDVHIAHQYMMDSAEICSHPHTPGILYVSNRWEKHIKRLQPHLLDVPEELPTGDAIGLLLLSKDGRKLEAIKHLRTNLDVIRGMRFSNDGKFIAVVGQEGGGIEVYSVSGPRADELTLAASFNSGLEAGIKHVVWL